MTASEAYNRIPGLLSLNNEQWYKKVGGSVG
jgi:hypothetical protein